MNAKLSFPLSDLFVGFGALLKGGGEFAGGAGAVTIDNRRAPAFAVAEVGIEKLVALIIGVMTGGGRGSTGGTGGALSGVCGTEFQSLEEKGKEEKEVKEKEEDIPPARRPSFALAKRGPSLLLLLLLLPTSRLAGG